MIDGRRVVVTGGAGSFGQAFVRRVLALNVGKVIVYSRDEYKHAMMREAIPDPRLQFFIGDVRDRDRLVRAMRGVDYVVHAAALKRVDALEYNPDEAVETNIRGAQNVIHAAIANDVLRVVGLSSDKACNPVNLYGSTKKVAEHLFMDGNAYSGSGPTRFACTRYGNVVGSRGSVVPLFERQRDAGGPITITDPGMTRFWMTLDESVDLVLLAMAKMRGGEVFVPKLPAVTIPNLAEAVAPGVKVEVIGVRAGEKLHEVMVGPDEARNTLEYADHFRIVRNAEEYGGTPLAQGFEYSSNKARRLNTQEIREALR